MELGQAGGREAACRALLCVLGFGAPPSPGEAGAGWQTTLFLLSPPGRPKERGEGG